MATLLWAALVAASSVVISLAGARFPSGFWEGRMVWFAVSVLVLALAGLRPSISKVLGERSIADEHKILDALKATYVQIVDGTRLDWKEIGLHAFIVKRTWPRLWEEHQIRGCIAADAPGGAYEDLWDDRVMEALHDAGLWVKDAARKMSRA